MNYNIQSGGIEARSTNRPALPRLHDERGRRPAHRRDQDLARGACRQPAKADRGPRDCAGIFRFFGSNLFDINAGSKDLEPVQLGVRTTLEQGVLELISTVTQTPAGPCMEGAKTAAGEPLQYRQRLFPPNLQHRSLRLYRLLLLSLQPPSRCPKKPRPR
ncbi:hypothetical protein [Comamonas sp. JC664]|uniref:hypothetical protein n=1 Tax=Comamonas sp. JC664 TaxID=2801917 RepID=UPI00360FEDB2